MFDIQLQTYETKNVADYLRLISKTFKEDETYFRGQSCDLDLLPGIIRLEKRGEFETRLQLEKQIIADFKRQSLPFLTHTPRDAFEWLAIAQHHGLPTRLLDWSVNPLAALWFAVRTPLATKYGVVWAFECKLKDQIDRKKSLFSQGQTKVFQPSHTTPRIIAQSGRFTIHHIFDTGHAVPLNKMSKFVQRLHKFIIPKNAIADVRFELDRCGINAASMLPDLDGICSNIKWRYSLSDDEKLSCT